MAKPRVFISSTFFDLRQIREDVERLVIELGYEPVRNETGYIPYGKEDPLENYAYREVELCDIIVTIIGGRYGTESQSEKGYSITQNELKTALDHGIQVFIFIDHNVLAEYSTFKLNLENKNTKYKYVDNIKVYEFIESIYQLKRNNTIAPFQTSKDIVEYLKNQWAGLFQRFLQEQKRLSELKVLTEMKAVASTLEQLVDFLTKERKNKDNAIQNILLSNHPAFRAFAKITNTNYRVYFTNRNELNEWLNARGWTLISKDYLDDDSICEWSNRKIQKYIKLTREIFDKNNKLKIFTEDEWNDKWLVVLQTPPVTQEIPYENNDLPF